MTAPAQRRDPRVDAFIDALPGWQKDVCRRAAVTRAPVVGFRGGRCYAERGGRHLRDLHRAVHPRPRDCLEWTRSSAGR